jgi:flagellar motor component MotA
MKREKGEASAPTGNAKKTISCLCVNTNGDGVNVNGDGVNCQTRPIFDYWRKKMNKNEMISKFTELAKRTLKFAKIAKKTNVSDLECEVEDLDDEDFREGLRHVIDGFPPTVIDEIFSNKIKFSKDEYERQYRSAMKRAVLGIQAVEGTNMLARVLMSHLDLTRKEKNQIESILMRD